MSGTRQVRVRGPASTANLGPGFDALGMALGLYNEVEVELTGDGLSLEVQGEGAERLQALGERNLVARSVTGTLERLGGPPGGVPVPGGSTKPVGRGEGGGSHAAGVGHRGWAGRRRADGGLLEGPGERHGSPAATADRPRGVESSLRRESRLLLCCYFRSSARLTTRVSMRLRRSWVIGWQGGGPRSGNGEEVR